MSVALAALACLCALWGVWRYSYLQALDQLARQARSDVALSSDRLTGQLQRYRDLAVLTADHPAVLDALASGQADGLSDHFLAIADRSSVRDLILLGQDGDVIASVGPGGVAASNRDLHRARNGALGWGYAVEGDGGARLFHFAAPVFVAPNRVEGIVLVRVDLAAVEWDWIGSNPAVFFTGQNGRVLATNRSELVPWRRDAALGEIAPPDPEAARFSIRRIANHEIWRMQLGPYLPDRAMHVVRDVPIIGMRAEALVDVTPARQLAMLQVSFITAVFIAFGAFLFLARVRRRTLAQANAQLEARVAERTSALTEANTRLRMEIEDRTEAERALARAQADLVQAEKLSALGQMSAGISHELNQPLMAIQSFSENAQAFLSRGDEPKARDNIGRIAELAGRMGRIIKNLRAFARQESTPAKRVDVVKIVESAVELTAKTVEARQVQLIYDPPDNPVWVRGGEVRLQQVFVNLITNAVDAMAQSDEKRLRVAISEGARLTVDFEDTGPGIDMPDKVFEPFYSTKTSADQDGMGLGLSISYGIVQSFGGDIRGTNTHNGALFSVELERAQEVKAA